MVFLAVKMAADKELITPIYTLRISIGYKTLLEQIKTFCAWNSLKWLKNRWNKLMSKNPMTMLPLTSYLCFLRAPRFACGNWPNAIFGALTINKSGVVLVLIIATLRVNLFKILFTRLWTAFYMSPIFFAGTVGSPRSYENHFE